MGEYASVNIRLTRGEFERLSEEANRELRHPRDQARFLIRKALGLTNHDAQLQPMSNRVGEVLPDADAVVR